MRPARWLTWAGLGFLLLSAGVRSDAPDRGVKVFLEPPSATVGDPVIARLEIALPTEAASSLRFPPWRDRWGAVEILKVGEVRLQPSSGGVVASQELVLVSFEPGRHPLPPAEVSWGSATAQTAWTPEDLVLEIRSILPEGQEVAAAPPEPPVELPVPRAAWLAIGALTLANAIAAALVWRRRLLAQGAPTRAELAPFEELESELSQLSNGNLREANSLLSRAFRQYLSRTLELRALESTTRELERQLRQGTVPIEWVIQAVRVLRDCDRARFSPNVGTREELEQRRKEILTLAQQLEDRRKQAAVDSPMPKKGIVP